MCKHTIRGQSFIKTRRDVTLALHADPRRPEHYLTLHSLRELIASSPGCSMRELLVPTKPPEEAVRMAQEAAELERQHAAAAAAQAAASPEPEEQQDQPAPAVPTPQPAAEGGTRTRSRVASEAAAAAGMLPLGQQQQQQQDDDDYRPEQERSQKRRRKEEVNCFVLEVSLTLFILFIIPAMQEFPQWSAYCSASLVAHSWQRTTASRRLPPSAARCRLPSTCLHTGGMQQLCYRPQPIYRPSP